MPEADSILASEAARRTSTTSSMTNTSAKRVSISRALRDMRLDSLAPFPRSDPLSVGDSAPRLNADPNAPGNLRPDPANDPFVVTALRRRHRAIKRQLRYLFIYPLVYMIVWTIPFASHCLQYTDYFSRNPPYALQCASVSVLALQCAVDCCLFAFREKPWRHINADGTSSVPNNKDYNQTEKKSTRRSGLFWPSLKFWKTSRPAFWKLGIFARSPAVPGNEKKGKSRAEMAWESRIAYRRRDLEEARNLESREEVERKRRESDDRRGGRGRQWWEQEDKRRKDSALLGVEAIHSAENAVRSSTIVEEGGEDALDRSDSQEDISPHTSHEAVAGHSRELLEARQGKSAIRKSRGDLETTPDESSMRNDVHSKAKLLPNLSVQKGSVHDSRGTNDTKSMATNGQGDRGQSKEGEGR